MLITRCQAKWKMKNNLWQPRLTGDHLVMATPRSFARVEATLISHARHPLSTLGWRTVGTSPKGSQRAALTLDAAHCLQTLADKATRIRGDHCAAAGTRAQKFANAPSDNWLSHGADANVRRSIVCLYKKAESARACRHSRPLRRLLSSRSLMVPRAS